MGCPILLQGILPTQGSCIGRCVLYYWNTREDCKQHRRPESNWINQKRISVHLSSGKAFYLSNLFCFVLFLTIFGCAGSSLQHTGFSSCGAQAKLPCSMWNLSSLTRDRSHIPCIGRWILNHWITREVPRAKLYPGFKIHVQGTVSLLLKAPQQ